LASLRQNAPCLLAPHAEEHRSANEHASCPASLRCDASRSMRAHPSSSFETRARVRSLPNAFAVRAPQDEDEHRVVHSSRCQTAHLVLATRVGVRGLRLLLHSPRIEGWAERRETFGCSAEHPWGVHITRHARRLARRLASHDAGRSPLGAPPWRFWAPGPRFSHRHSRRIGYSELLAARS